MISLRIYPYPVRILKTCISLTKGVLQELVKTAIYKFLLILADDLLNIDKHRRFRFTNYRAHIHGELECRPLVSARRKGANFPLTVGNNLLANYETHPNALLVFIIRCWVLNLAKHLEKLLLFLSS